MTKCLYYMARNISLHKIIIRNEQKRFLFLFVAVFQGKQERDLGFEGIVEIEKEQETEELVEGEPILVVVGVVVAFGVGVVGLFARLNDAVEDAVGILCGAVGFTLVVVQEAEELVGGHGGGGAVGEGGEGLLDVRRRGLLGDVEFSVEVLEHFVAVGDGAHCYWTQRNEEEEESDGYEINNI